MSGIHQLMLAGHSVKHSWEEIVPTGTEPSGDRGGAVFVSDGVDFYLAGGRLAAGSQRTDLWKFNKSTKTWSSIASSGAVQGYGSPMGYINNAGTHLYFAADSSVFQTSAAAQRVDLATGTPTSMTGASQSLGARHGAVNRANDIVYSAGLSGGAIYEQRKAVLSGTTSTDSAQGYSATGKYVNSSAAYRPTDNALYMLSLSGGSTLSTNSIIKYDIASNTDWTRETGITNNVGSVTVNSATQMVWVPSQSLFYLFVNNTTTDYLDQIFSYDPATKEFGPVIASGTTPKYLIANDSGAYNFDATGQTRGEMGKVCVQSDGVYFITAGADNTVTNARIWRLRFNY